MLWMPLRAACVVVVRRGGVVDVAATLVVLWLFVMRRGNPDRFVNCGKSVLAFWEVQTIWNTRDEICNGALYFGTTYKNKSDIFIFACSWIKNSGIQSVAVWFKQEFLQINRIFFTLISERLPLIANFYTLIAARFRLITFPN